LLGCFLKTLPLLLRLPQPLPHEPFLPRLPSADGCCGSVASPGTAARHLTFPRWSCSAQQQLPLQDGVLLLFLLLLLLLFPLLRV
jgi:hypothetical protein